MTVTLKLGLLAASPMYYQAPLYRLLASKEGIDFTAVFASSGGVKARDVGFGSPHAWDIDILSGYRHLFLRKAESNPIGGSFFTLRDWDIVSLVSRSRFDVLWVHGYNIMTNVLAVLTQRLVGGSVMLREEQTLLASRPTWKQSAKRLGLPLLFGDAATVYIGNENRRWLESFGFARQRMFPAPYCVDAERLQRSAGDEEGAKLRLQLGVPSGVPVILSVSRLAHEKQPVQLLDAFARVRRAHRAVLLFVGTGELEGALRAKVRHDAIPDVIFAGFINQSHIAAVYRAADLFVLFSEYEPWGVVVNEAMHLSLPVVASDRVGSAADMVREGVTGYVVGHRDVDGLARRLTELVTDPALRLRMGRAARIHSGHWNYERAATGIVAAARAAVRPA